MAATRGSFASRQVRLTSIGTSRCASPAALAAGLLQQPWTRSPAGPGSLPNPDARAQPKPGRNRRQDRLNGHAPSRTHRRGPHASTRSAYRAANARNATTCSAVISSTMSTGTRRRRGTHTSRTACRRSTRSRHRPSPAGVSRTDETNGHAVTSPGTHDVAAGARRTASMHVRAAAMWSGTAAGASSTLTPVGPSRTRADVDLSPSDVPRSRRCLPSPTRPGRRSPVSTTHEMTAA